MLLICPAPPRAAAAPADDQASGWACQRCCAAAPGALCWHKAPASAAALCFLDCRVAGGMVARYATHHRSLYPHLEACREHFLLTSHAAVPVAVWDRRCVPGLGWGAQGSCAMPARHGCAAWHACCSALLRQPWCTCALPRPASCCTAGR